jgi:hypothetical protein
MTEQLVREREAGAASRACGGDVAVAVAALVAAALTWLVWSEVVGVTMEVNTSGGTRQVELMPVVVTTMVCVLTGGALLRWLARRSERGTRTWTWIAVAFALASLIGPASATSAASAVALASLHLVVAGIAIPALRQANRGR